MSGEAKAAFVTLVATDEYVPGGQVLAYSLRDVLTRHSLVCLVTSQVSGAGRKALAKAFDLLVDVPVLDSGDVEHLRLLGRAELGLTLTKIHAWNLTQFRRAVFLDADTFVLRNVDELLNTNEQGVGRYTPFAAAPDSGWPDCFNSGVFLYEPSTRVFEQLQNLAKSSGSFDGADQGLLNSYFSDWPRQGPEHRLPFTYNVTPSAVYSYAPAYQVFKDDIAIMHFIGATKPWHWTRLYDGALISKGTEFHEIQKHVERWWSIHDTYVSKWKKEHGAFSKETALSFNAPSQSFGNLSGSYGHGDGNAGTSGRSQPADDFGTFQVGWSETELCTTARPISARPGSRSASKTSVRLTEEEENMPGSWVITGTAGGSGSGGSTASSSSTSVAGIRRDRALSNSSVRGTESPTQKARGVRLTSFHGSPPK